MLPERERAARKREGHNATASDERGPLHVRARPYPVWSSRGWGGCGKREQPRRGQRSLRPVVDPLGFRLRDTNRSAMRELDLVWARNEPARRWAPPADGNLSGGCRAPSSWVGPRFRSKVPEPHGFATSPAERKDFMLAPSAQKWGTRAGFTGFRRRSWAV